jgi:predicted AAA+ superfamily ATPase
MTARYLDHALRDIAFPDHKIALVSGPRQVGKTTLARALLKQRGRGAYHNGDDVAFRRALRYNA